MSARISLALYASMMLALCLATAVRAEDMIATERVAFETVDQHATNIARQMYARDFGFVQA